MLKKTYALWPCKKYPFWVAAPVVGFSNNGQINVRIGKKTVSVRSSKLLSQKEGRKVVKRLRQLKAERHAALVAVEKEYEDKLNTLQTKYL